MKLVTGSSCKMNSLCDGDNEKLANLINVFYQSVSSDLPKPDKTRLPTNHESVPHKDVIHVLDV